MPTTEPLEADDRAAAVSELETPSAPTIRYPMEAAHPLAWYLLAAVAVFGGMVLLGHLLPEEKLPPLLEVDLGVEAVENEPPPLGEVTAGAGAVAPEPESVPEPEPVPETPPPPEPVPTPETPPTAFIVPTEDKPPPAPKPKPAPIVREKKEEKPRRAPVARPSNNADQPAGGGEQTGEIGIHGSPAGKPGGKGGSKGDFISTPHPQYDQTSRERNYQGSGMFIIHYANGGVTGCSVARSTGFPYLDARTVSWITSRWKVKPGVSGTVSLPVTWQLR